MESELIINQARDVPAAAAELLSRSKGRYFFAFYGNLGAGKTTLIKALCHQLGAEDEGASPSFALVNEYATADDSAADGILHMDLYRLQTLEEALDIGIEEYLDRPNTYCFVEWPELIEPLFPKDAVSVSITPLDDGSRKLHLKG